MATVALGLTAVELAGDSALKAAAGRRGDGTAAFALVGVAAYASLGYLIFKSDQSGAQWGIVNSYWNAINNVVTPLAMMYFFNEHYTTTQWMGIVVIAAGILLMGDS